mmetsp:Transcript_22040/g.41522  ORF Transcript_22040/g.41522 Transcript_22040/m.41522 type:complete len:306 (-) Transcript_22040:131-1048(-)
MSLASLLSLGRKDEPSKPPPPEKPKPAPESATGASASIVQNEEDRKLALELAEKQADLLSEEMLIKEAEEEAAKEREIEEAAKAAAALAAKQRLQAATTGANPFSTGGRVYQPGVFVCDERSGHKPAGAVSFIPSAQEWFPPGNMFPAGFQVGQPQFRQLSPAMLGNEQARMKMPATFMPGGPGAKPPVEIPPRERSRSRERQGEGGWDEPPPAPPQEWQSGAGNGQEWPGGCPGKGGAWDGGAAPPAAAFPGYPPAYPPAYQGAGYPNGYQSDGCAAYQGGYPTPGYPPEGYAYPHPGHVYPGY